MLVAHRTAAQVKGRSERSRLKDLIAAACTRTAHTLRRGELTDETTDSP